MMLIMRGSGLRALGCNQERLGSRFSPSVLNLALRNVKVTAWIGRTSSSSALLKESAAEGDSSKALVGSRLVHFIAMMHADTRLGLRINICKLPTYLTCCMLACILPACMHVNTYITVLIFLVITRE